MNKLNFYILLNITHKNGSVLNLTRNGITFTEIAKQTQRAIENGYMENINNSIQLTLSGIEFLNSLEKEFKNINKDEWIEKDLQNKIEPIDKNVIFVPRQSELHF